jgi:hypothetical protein
MSQDIVLSANKEEILDICLNTGKILLTPEKIDKISQDINSYANDLQLFSSLTKHYIEGDATYLPYPKYLGLSDGRLINSTRPRDATKLMSGEDVLRVYEPLTNKDITHVRGFLLKFIKLPEKFLFVEMIDALIQHEQVYNMDVAGYTGLNNMFMENRSVLLNNNRFDCSKLYVGNDFNGDTPLLKFYYPHLMGCTHTNISELISAESESDFDKFVNFLNGLETALMNTMLYKQLLEILEKNKDRYITVETNGSQIEIIIRESPLISSYKFCTNPEVYVNTQLSVEGDRFWLE